MIAQSREHMLALKSKFEMALSTLGDCKSELSDLKSDVNRDTVASCLAQLNRSVKKLVSSLFLFVL